MCNKHQPESLDSSISGLVWDTESRCQGGESICETETEYNCVSQKVKGTVCCGIINTFLLTKTDMKLAALKGY